MARHSLIRLILCAALSLFVGRASAQVIVGRVVDDMGEPLEYVTIGVLGTQEPLGAVSDSKGRFELKLPLSDSLTLKFSLVGYEPLMKVVRVEAGEELPLVVAMTPAATSLKSVTIEDDKVRRSTFTQIDIQKLENNVGPQDGVESVIKTLPDVASNNELTSQYSVRGGSFDENLVYINGVEIYRPMLVRCGEQEGMSIINPDMVENVQFSPGGFDASYGDRMSSVLDIQYRRPVSAGTRLSASFLGGSLWTEGVVGEKFAYSLGARRHSNRYILGSLDTKGDYNTDYTDLQVVLDYKVDDRFDIEFLAVGTHNDYALKPTDRQTDFGSFDESLHLDIYFDGEEADSYSTLLSALKLDWRPADRWDIQGIFSVQGGKELENYDIQSQYWLREALVGAVSDTMFDRGVGTFLEHARNSLQTRICSAELKAVRFTPNGNWNMGLKFQYEDMRDNVREWKWVDSAGYAVPTAFGPWGDASNEPFSPELQRFYNSHNTQTADRLSAYLLRSLSIRLKDHSEFSLAAGIRSQLYQTEINQQATPLGLKMLVSPRVSLCLKPYWEKDLLFKLTAGIYHQPPFYREYRYVDGTLNPLLEAQHSYQAVGTADWNFKMWDSPFRLIVDLYYKYLTNLVPYTIENLRMRYDAENSAVGYVAGLSMRLNGYLVEGLESWVSLSVMKTQEDILGDAYGWISRPTDQRFSFKMFLQDNIPDLPFWRMSLSFIAAGGTPYTSPHQADRSVTRRLPPYLRVDWGNTVQLSQFPKLKNKKLFQKVDEISLSLEVFNLFNYHNVVSLLWVADIDNRYYGVPNFLTARQLNLKATVSF